MLELSHQSQLRAQRVQFGERLLQLALEVEFVGVVGEAKRNVVRLHGYLFPQFGDLHLEHCDSLAQVARLQLEVPAL